MLPPDKKHKDANFVLEQSEEEELEREKGGTNAAEREETVAMEEALSLNGYVMA